MNVFGKEKKLFKNSSTNRNEWTLKLPVNLYLFLFFFLRALPDGCFEENTNTLHQNPMPRIQKKIKVP